MPKNEKTGLTPEQHQEVVLELRKTQEMLQLVMDNIPQHIFWKDRTSTYLGCNQNFARAAGLDSPQEIIGKTDYDLPWKREESDFFRSVDRRVMDSDQAELNIVEPVRQAGGKEAWVQTNKVPLHDEHGEVFGVLGTYEDITERREAEQKLERYNQQLEQLVEERTAEAIGLESCMQQTQRLESLGVLAGGVAHDFSNLLVGVIGNTDVALAELDEASPAVPLLKEALAAATQAGELCRQMLACANQGQLQLRAEPLDLGQAVSGLKTLLRSSIPKPLNLRLQIDEETPACVADPSLLQQALLNLVTNSIESMGDKTGGMITVRTGLTECDRARLEAAWLPLELVAGSYAFIEVRDTGSGMDEETRGKIFDPFFTTKFIGRGLGLPAVYGIMRAFEGAIEVESAPKSGTCVRLLIPALHRGAAQARAPVPADVEPAVPERIEGARILIVDDEPTVRTIGRRILERAGCQVSSAKDGLEAVERFAAGHEEIDCVLLDLTMPRMGGMEALDHMLRIHPEAKIVLSTGYNVDDLPEQVLQEQLSGVLYKPYRAAELVQTVKTVLSTAAAG